MTDTKEAFELALRIVHTWLSVGGAPTPCAGIEKQLSAIRAHVAALEGEVAELKAQLDAIEENDTEERNRNAELRQTINQMMETSAKDVERYQAVYAELASVKAERDELKSQMEAIEENDTEERNRYLELRRRVESAPKVWLKWAKTADGRRSLDNAAATPQLECFGFQECYAVPVATEESSVDDFRDVTKLVEEDR